VAAAALVLLPASAASAHDYLVSSTPKAGSTVATALPRVTLTFDAAVLGLSKRANVVQVTSAAGRHFETACATVDGASVSVPVALGADGAYTVRWRVVSADGHTVTDSLRFDYRHPAGATAAAGSASGPGCGTLATGAAADPNASVSPALLIGLGVCGGIVLAALVAVIVVLRRVLKAPEDAAEEGEG
jgi:methionine-rich copper-binding protein CopC